MVRIPLDIVATATGHKTKGILVGVMVSDLDALEAEKQQLWTVARAAEKVVAMLSAQSNPRRDGGSKALVEACYELAETLDRPGGD